MTPGDLDTMGLRLAAAAASGDASAIERLSALCEREVVRVCRQFGPASVAPDELRQRVLELVLVGTETRPRALPTYSGRGGLGRWLRAIAARLMFDALREHRAAERALTEASAMVLGLTGESPESAALYGRVDALIPQVLAGALDALSPRERNLLRLRYVRGLKVDEIAKAYGLHRVSTSRLLAEAQRRLSHQVRAALKATLPAGSAELDSLLRGLSRPVDLDVRRALGSEPEEEPRRGAVFTAGTARTSS